MQASKLIPTVDQIGVVQHSDTAGTAFVGRPAVDLYRLIALKSALNFEIRSKGQMRLSRRYSALGIAKTVTGLKTNDRTVHLAKVVELIAEAEGRVVHVTDGGAA